MSIIVFICVLCIIAYLIFKYRPTIEIIVNNYYEVYIQYDSWRGIKYKGRKSKYLFKL